MYVGRTTRKTLTGRGVRNIGQLAAADPEQLRQALGKLGPELRLYALGRDEAPVRRADEAPEVKSVGNGMTFRRDLVSRDDVAAGLTALSDEVAARLRAHGLLCTAVQVLIKDTELRSITRQAPLPAPTHLARDIARAAQALVEKNWPAQKPIRMLTVTALNLTDGTGARQLSWLEPEPQSDEKREKLEQSLDAIRKKYGKASIASASRLNSDLGLGPLSMNSDEDAEP